MTKYSYQTFIPFHLADPAGVLFFGHAFTITHQAYEQFVIHALQWEWKKWFENPTWIVPIKHTQADYFHPIVTGEECKAELSLSNLSQSSFTLTTELIQNTLCCRLQTVHVFCNRLTKQKVPIPEDVRSKLTQANVEALT